MRIFLLIAELNDLDTFQEKIWTRAGPEFGQYECKVFIIVMALYGLKYNGSEFMEFLAEQLGNMHLHGGSIMYTRRDKLYDPK